MKLIKRSCFFRGIGGRIGEEHSGECARVVMTMYVYVYFHHLTHFFAGTKTTKRTRTRTMRRQQQQKQERQIRRTRRQRRGG